LGQRIVAFDVAIGVDLNVYVSILLFLPPVKWQWAISADARENASSRPPAHIPSVVIVTPTSITVDRSYSRLRRHPLGGDDYNFSAHLQGQCPQVVERVINLRVCQVVELDVTGRRINPAGYLAVGFDE
jgi:hypothetical protein